MSYHDWRVAYAKQARADLQAREALLTERNLPACQQLHFLQMACEKLCKAHRCGKEANPSDLSRSHAYIEKTIPVIFRQYRAEKWLVGASRELARKIELLAPAVKDGGRVPANCEYPWEGPDGRVLVPSEHNFQLEMLYEPAGTELLKLLHTLCEDLLRPAPMG